MQTVFYLCTFPVEGLWQLWCYFHIWAITSISDDNTLTNENAEIKGHVDIAATKSNRKRNSGNVARQSGCKQANSLTTLQYLNHFMWTHLLLHVSNNPLLHKKTVCVCKTTAGTVG